MGNGYLFFGIISILIGGYLIWRIGATSTLNKQNKAQIPMLGITLSLTFFVMGGGLLIYYFIMKMKLPP